MGIFWGECQKEDRFMAIVLMLVAALFIAGSNLFLRKSIDGGGSFRAYLMIQFFIVFLVMVLLNPVRTGQYAWSDCMAGFGLTGGIFAAGLMAFIGKSLEQGPPGLTFAAVNSATVMPTIVMVLLFGAAFGYEYTLWNGVGSILVVMALVWAGWGLPQSEKKHRWVMFVTAAFLMHLAFLCFLQWRALFVNFPGANGLLLSFDLDDAVNQWFMPMVFLSATFIQTVIYVSGEKRLPKKAEVQYGILGGIANGVGTFFMIWATEVSTPLLHAMIFPILAVGIIVLCNIWGKWLYKEKVNWLANAVALLGILIGSVNWGVIFK